MAAPEDSNAHRRRKLETLRARGGAYPNDFRRKDFAADLAAAHGAATKPALEAAGVAATVAGRLMLRRVMGKASFLTLADPSGRIQCYLRLEDIGEEAYEDFKTLMDLGDVVGVDGVLMKTNKGELTVQAKHVALLAKALHPWPEKYHGLADRETRYRQRYLDLATSEETRAAFRTRAAIVSALRRFFDGRGFLEVETPMMHPIPGGARARPFVTRHHGLGADLYLRVAPELYLKRLVVGGFERVYEIGRCFRNEGLSPRHNPEFTMLEFYQAFADHADLMDLTEELLRWLLAELNIGDAIAFDGHEIDLRGAFRRVSMTDAVADAVGTPPDALRNRDALAALASRLGLPAQPDWGWGRLLMETFEARVEDSLVQPTFITGYPAEVSPLSRRNDDHPLLADRFELFIAGREIANGFSELNDPDDQAARFRDQAARGNHGDQEAMHYDQDYVAALEYGMPPTAGEGIGIDRLAMLLTGATTIRDVVLFPQLRRRGPSDEEAS